MRREFLKAIGLVSAAALPAVATAEVLDAEPGDVVVLKFNELLSREAVERLRASWAETMKGHALASNRVVIIGGGAEISIVRRRLTRSARRP